VSNRLDADSGGSYQAVTITATLSVGAMPVDSELVLETAAVTITATLFVGRICLLDSELVFETARIQNRGSRGSYNYRNSVCRRNAS